MTVGELAPGARKAIKWNSPFYGVDGQGRFPSFHVLTRAVKVTFLRGTALTQVPPGGTSREARRADVHEDGLDETQIAARIRQAAALPAGCRDVAGAPADGRGIL